MKNMYKNTEVQDLICDNCGSSFRGFISNATIDRNYCCLECEYESNKRKKHSYELSTIIIEHSLEFPYKSARDIAKIFGVSKDYVTNLIKRYGNREPKKLIDFNRDYFKTIDTEEKAYWLGFIYADGYVSIRGERGSLEIGLAEIDRSHLEKFCKSIGMKNKHIRSKKVKLAEKTFDACRLNVSSYEIARDLVNLKCFETKSLILEFPTFKEVPKDLMRHFIRGYIDGDGTVGFYGGVAHVSAIGTRIFLKGMLDFLNSEIKDFGSTNTNAGDKRLQNEITTSFSKTANKAKQLLNYLYKDSSIHLDRKYEKYLTCVSH